MRLILTLVVAASLPTVLILLAAAPLAAEIITTPLIEIGDLDEVNDGTTPVALPRFDSSLGTLTSVKVTIFVPFSFFRVQAKNFGNDLATGQFTSSASYYVDHPSVGTQLLASLGGTLTTYDFNAGEERELASTITGGEGSYASSDADWLAAFTGNGDILLPIQVDGSTSLVGVTAIGDFLGPMNSPQFQAEYTYTAVPEPSSLLLCGFLGGAAAWRARRRR